jgi:sec-independent protein translocase protein TatB
MAEFRKASNDFKYQFHEEILVSEQAEQQKKQEAERAALATAKSAVPAATAQLGAPEPTILPPDLAAGHSSGVTADMVADHAASDSGAGEIPASSEAVPYAVSAISATTGEEHPVDDHPLLRVDVIPPMPEAPASPTAPEGASTDLNRLREEDGAPLHHG